MEHLNQLWQKSKKKKKKSVRGYLLSNTIFKWSLDLGLGTWKGFRVSAVYVYLQPDKDLLTDGCFPKPLFELTLQT